MTKIWIFFLFFSVFNAANAQSNEDSAFPDYWQSDYEDQWYADELRKLGIINNANAEPFGKDTLEEDTQDASVEKNDVKNIEELFTDDKNEEIKSQLQNTEAETNSNQVPLDDTKSYPFDYQFEDNRSELKEEEDNMLEIDSIIYDGDTDKRKSTEVKEADQDDPDVNYLPPSFDNNIELPSSNENDNENIFDETRIILESDDDDNIKFDDPTNMIPLTIDSQPSIENISDETKMILQETNEVFGESPSKATEKSIAGFGNEVDLIIDSQPKIEDIINETKPILQETNGDFNESPLNTTKINVGDSLVVNSQSNIKDIISETKTILQETSDSFDENQLNSIKSNIPNPEVEEKYVNSEEKNIVKESYSDINEDLDKLFETWEKLNADGDDINSRRFVIPHDLPEFLTDDDIGELLDDFDENDYVNVDDSNLHEIFAEIASKLNDESVENNELNPSDDIQQSEGRTEKYNRILYLNDALNADENENKANEVSSDIITTTVDQIKVDTSTIKSVRIENLTDGQYNDLIKQFSLLHSDDLDTESDDFDKHVAPIHISLNVNESVVVTSPNYPDPYPTNNIIDWIFDGEGSGIEFNITDFHVDGALGDYLLVKPGGVDDTGSDGLIFSYYLKKERLYKFMDVNRLFVRFEAKPGATKDSSKKGFKFSVRMLENLIPEPEPILIPEPELSLPTSLLTTHLGISVQQFLEIKEEFRLLIADMAETYIRANQIDPGLNTTMEVTQINSSTVCNINWPNYEACVKVKFGVPLVYEDKEAEHRLNEDDLDAMWYTYIYEDPFALRLRRLGITEFSIPNDSNVLMIWLVISAGVIISMAMLGVALWRFTCFENYTRMPVFSDTESLHNEKIGDLYPTPHQNLPPLYENEYSWNVDDSARESVGGFANKSYVREDVYQVDSDEDVNTSSRNRYTKDV